MNDILRLTTQFALARVFKEFAIKLGVGEEFSDILAQVHVSSSRILENWSKFLESNCAGCSSNTEACIFLNPQEKNCVRGATPANTRRANVTSVESGILKKCPAFSPKR